MQIKYFSAAWNDISHSKGWFGKLCLLGLLLFVPVFGIMVLFGYLYGWAREMAWGVHEPLPAKIFGNEDGKLYRRGFYLLVFDVVLVIALNAILGLVGLIPGMVQTNAVSLSGFNLEATEYNAVYYVVYFVLAIIESFILWIGSMRISIYDRLSAGFQLGKIGKMYRYAPAGIWRILGMQLAVGIILAIVISFVFSFLIGGIMVGAVGSLGVSLSDLTAGSSYILGIRLLTAAGPWLLLVLVLMLYVCMVAAVFLEMLCARALGYWAMQFDIPHWRGQDDPMPFELQVR